MTWSVKNQRCEWCEATDDLVESTLGNPRLTILTCNNRRECETRWPEQWPPGRIGVPYPHKPKAAANAQ
jgi:hypothetical protein